jgi:ATP-binding cassette subfamily F protein uup
MLEEALAAFPGTILVVSHDRYFLDRICDQIVAFEDDGVKVSPGNFSYYLEKRQARENAARAQATAANRAAKKRASEKKDKPRKLTMAEAKELETLEEKGHGRPTRLSLLCKRNFLHPKSKLTSNESRSSWQS